jgi:choline dehydrogenase-like flavoprotein
VIAPGTHLAFQTGAPVELEADYVVVGSGAGGAAAAATLVRAGRSVCVVERGPWRDPQHYPLSVYGAMRDLWSDWGTLFARGRSMIPILQASCVGGTTVINSAIVVRTPPAVLAEWAELGLGEVFSEAAVGAEQEALERELGVTRMHGRQLMEHSEALLRALRSRGLEGHALDRSARDCIGSGQCLQGCREGAKTSTNLCWVPEVITRGGTVLTCAPVGRVTIERGRAVGVSGRFVHPAPRRGERRRGARFSVRARRGVLLAASATGSAPLLERSGVRSAALGRGWRGQPGAAMIGVYPHEVRMERGTTQGAASLAYRSEGFKLESLSLPLELLAARVGGAGHRYARALEEAPRMAMWVAAVRAQAQGVVRAGRFGQPVVRYAPSRADTERLRAGLGRLARLHFDAGAEKVLPGIHGVAPELGPDELGALESAPLDNRCYTWVLSHLFGGCVMGKDPRRSVVAPDLHVRGVRGLHVVDAACLPTTLGVNPQHTIMAVARIIAARVVNEENVA